MKTVAVIQARMGSSRLPGKVMLPLVGSQPVLGVIVDRLRAARRLDAVVVATSRKQADAEITKWCAMNRVDSFCGSEDDVLDRVYQAALATRADSVVDITADCPLVDPRHVDRLVGELAGDRRGIQGDACEGSPDYVSNCFYRDWPDGLDVQCYTVDALERAWRNPKAIREHVGWNIPHLSESAGEEFLVRQPLAPPKYHLPEWGLTLDEPDDYRLLRTVFTEMVLRYGDALFPAEAAINWLRENPDILAINAGVKRKEPGK